jgi:hypothetical protein
LRRSKEIVSSPKRSQRRLRIFVGRLSTGFSSISEVQMRTLIAAAMLTAFAFTPASAKMMACTSDNMMKSTMMMAPGQSAANKELGMANADMSMGKSKSACMHYMKAQKAAMMK